MWYNVYMESNYKKHQKVPFTFDPRDHLDSDHLIITKVTPTHISYQFIHTSGEPILVPSEFEPDSDQMTMTMKKEHFEEMITVNREIWG